MWEGILWPVPNTPVAPSKFQRAEEELFSWLLRAPQCAELCNDLDASCFSSQDAWALFEAISQAAQAQLTDQALVDRVVTQRPHQQKEIFKLVMLQLPEDFEPQRDIAAGAARLKQTGIQKRLKEVQRQMKTLGAGNVPASLIEEYKALYTKLKK